MFLFRKDICGLYFMTFRLGWQMILGLYKRVCLLIVKFISFWLHSYCGSDCPKSVRNSCVIEDFSNVFVLSLDFHFLMV